MLIVFESKSRLGPILNTFLMDYGKIIAYRFGCTGTLPKGETDSMSVKIAVGEVQYTIPSYLLIAKGVLANLKIDIIQMDVNLKKQHAQFLEDTKDEADIPEMSYSEFKDAYCPEFTSENKFLHSDKLLKG